MQSVKNVSKRLSKTIKQFQRVLNVSKESKRVQKGLAASKKIKILQKAHKSIKSREEFKRIQKESENSARVQRNRKKVQKRTRREFKESLKQYIELKNVKKNRKRIQNDVQEHRIVQKGKRELGSIQMNSKKCTLYKKLKRIQEDSTGSPRRIKSSAKSSKELKTCKMNLKEHKIIQKSSKYSKRI